MPVTHFHTFWNGILQSNNSFPSNSQFLDMTGFIQFPIHTKMKRIPWMRAILCSFIQMVWPRPLMSKVSNSVEFCFEGFETSRPINQLTLWRVMFLSFSITTRMAQRFLMIFVSWCWPLKSFPKHPNRVTINPTEIKWSLSWIFAIYASFWSVWRFSF